MKKLLLATRGKVFTLQNMPQLIAHTRLAHYRSQQPYQRPRKLP